MVEEINEVRGIFVAFPGLAGCGKTTIHTKLVEKYPNEFERPPNFTTRNERPEEKKKRLKHGTKSYVHLKPEQFKAKLEEKDIFGEVNFCGSWYGMSISAIKAVWKKGKIAVNDCQMKGIEAARKKFGSDFIAIFVTPHEDDNEALRISALRLCKRTHEELSALDIELKAEKNPERQKEIKAKMAMIKASFRERLEDNKEYIKLKKSFHYVIINKEGEFEKALAQAYEIIQLEKNKSNSFTNSKKEDTLPRENF